MAKKQDSFYYENFSECAACACQAAHYLEESFSLEEFFISENIVYFCRSFGVILKKIKLYENL